MRQRVNVIFVSRREKRSLINADFGESQAGKIALLLHEVRDVGACGVAKPHPYLGTALVTCLSQP